MSAISRIWSIFGVETGFPTPNKGLEYTALLLVLLDGKDKSTLEIEQTPFRLEPSRGEPVSEDDCMLSINPFANASITKSGKIRRAVPYILGPTLKDLTNQMRMASTPASRAGSCYLILLVIQTLRIFQKSITYPFV